MKEKTEGSNDVKPFLTSLLGTHFGAHVSPTKPLPLFTCICCLHPYYTHFCSYIPASHTLKSVKIKETNKGRKTTMTNQMFFLHDSLYTKTLYTVWT